MVQLLLWASFAFTLTILAYASILDFRKREVSNWVWIFAYPACCALTFSGWITGVFELEVVLISVGISTMLSLMLFFIGFYGGADVKSLILVGLALPISPHTTTTTTNPIMPFILTIFLNVTILSLAWPLSVFALNIKDTLRGCHMFEGIKLSPKQKLWLLFTKRKIPLEKLSLKYLPAETITIQENGTPTKRVLHFVRAETDLTKHLEILEKHKEHYKNGVLASPTIPTLCFFTPALAISIFFGNLLSLTITLLMQT